jgi:aldehyde:ferredoxin oxidoreductase
MKTYQAETILKKEVGDNSARVAVIGPAAERLSNFGLVQNDYFHHAGRGGIGAILGSKNLKALVIRGTGSISLAHPDSLLGFIAKDVLEKRLMPERKEAVRNRMRYGTTYTSTITNKVGILPVRNFQEGRFQLADNIDPYAFERILKVSDKACFCCSFPCNNHSIVRSGPYKGVEMVGPQYESIALLGPNLGIDSFEAILHLNYLCDNLGMDTIGAGNAVGFAIECYQEGLLTKEDFDGLTPQFGDPEFASRLLHKIAYREGIGDLFAQGVKKASEVISRSSEVFAMHGKGLEYPGYRPGMNSPGFALAYAITERGACHRRAWVATREQSLKPASTEGRASLVKELYDKRIPLDSGVLCTVPIEVGGITVDDVAVNLLSPVTGWKFQANDMEDLADRVATLIRLFNLREGLTKEDDLRLAPRTFQREVTAPNEGKMFTREMLEMMVDEYYALRGWDRQGKPKEETLRRLGLGPLSKQCEEIH